MHEDSTINPPLYRDLWVRILVPIPAAHLVLAINEPENFIELVQLPGYLPLLLQNSILVFLIFNCVRSITIVLDKDFSWAERLHARMFFQVFFGMGIPILLCLVLASLYFSHHDMDMAATGYMKLELWFSVLFIAFINSYYSLYYFALVKPDVEPPDQAGSRIWTLTRAGEIRKAKESDIALFYVEEGVRYACLMNGERYTVDRSIEMLMDELSEKEFFKVSRSVIVNRRAIAGFKVESSNRLLLQFNGDVERDFYVSQRNVKEFKRWLG